MLMQGIIVAIKTKIFDIVLKSRPFLAPTLTDSAKCDLKANNTIQAKGKLEKPIHLNLIILKLYFYLVKYTPQIILKKYFTKKFIEISSVDKNYQNETKEAQNSLAQLEAKNLDNMKKSD